MEDNRAFDVIAAIRHGELGNNPFATIMVTLRMPDGDLVKKNHRKRRRRPGVEAAFDERFDKTNQFARGRTPAIRGHHRLHRATKAR